MEWIDQFQQLLSRPVLTFVREHRVYLLVALSIAAWWFLGGAESRKVTVSTDLTSGESDGGGGGGDWAVVLTRWDRLRPNVGNISAGAPSALTFPAGGTVPTSPS